MMQRKYSVGEIDRMRHAIRWSYPDNVSYQEEQRSREIEDKLRTHMLNGTDPAELEAAMWERIGAIQAAALGSQGGHDG